MVKDKTRAEACCVRALAAAGGAANLMRSFAVHGVLISEQAIGQWIWIPHKRVELISKITGIPLHELRPDLYPAPAGAQSRATRR